MKRALTFIAGVAFGAFAFGAVTTSAAGPYVYGCGPFTLEGVNSGIKMLSSFSIYNGSAATANLTHKVLTGNGTQVGGSFTPPIPTTSTLAPTKTATFSFIYLTGDPSSTDGTIPNSARVVSDVPVAVTFTYDNNNGSPAQCSRLSPD
jgi:hypothetical protein